MKRPCIPSELADLFERAIDSHGLANVVDALAEICAAKADHIRANWQDGVTAHPWAQSGSELAHVEEKIARLGL